MGTAPNRFGADRNSAPVEVVEADNLYKVYDPVALGSSCRACVSAACGAHTRLLPPARSP